MNESSEWDQVHEMFGQKYKVLYTEPESNIIKKQKRQNFHENPTPSKLLLNSSIQMNEDCEDSQTSQKLRNPALKKLGKCCALKCTNYKTLHRCPIDEESRELWRKKLRLKKLRKSHRICSNHFSTYKKKRLPGFALPDSPDRKEYYDFDEIDNNYLKVKLEETYSNFETACEFNEIDDSKTSIVNTGEYAESGSGIAKRLNSLKKWLQTDEFCLLRTNTNS